MRNQPGVKPAGIDFGPRRSILTLNNPIIGYRRNGRPIRLIAGGSESPPESPPAVTAVPPVDTPAEPVVDDTPGQTGDDEQLPENHPIKVALRKANKEAEKARLKVKEFEDRDKTELQKATEAVAEAEKAATQARTEALRYKIAAKHSITDEDADLFLNGSDEATITAQAVRYAELAKASTTPPAPAGGPVVPKSGTGGGSAAGGTVSAGRDLFKSSRSTDREKETNHA